MPYQLKTSSLASRSLSDD